MEIRFKGFLLGLILVLALGPITTLASIASCAVEGGVCGDAPTWDPCCNPDRFYCEKEDEDVDYGTCIPLEENKEEDY